MVDVNQKLKRAEDGPVGQHLDENDQLVITGEKNPLPNKLYAQDEAGSPVPLTVEKDENGNSVLRIVDAAPFAYDQSTDRLKVSMDRVAYDEAADRYKVSTEQVKKAPVLETVVNNVTVSASGNHSVMVPFTDEKEVWVFASTSSSNWRLRSGSMFAKTSVLANTTFPDLSQSLTKSFAVTSPAISLFLPIPANSNHNLSSPTTMGEAKNFLLQPGEGTYQFYYNNAATTDETFTLKILRVF